MSGPEHWHPIAQQILTALKPDPRRRETDMTDTATDEPYEPGTHSCGGPLPCSCAAGHEPGWDPADEADQPHHRQARKRTDAERAALTRTEADPCSS